MTRIFRILLSGILAIGLFPFSAFAIQNNSADDVLASNTNFIDNEFDLTEVNEAEVDQLEQDGSSEGASDSDAQVTVEDIAEPDGIEPISSSQDLSLQSEPSAQAEALSLTVSYDSNIKCDQPTKFTITGIGGSGRYKYMFDTLYLESEDYYYVTDPSRGKGFVESNVFEFTFTASGTYQCHFQIIDTVSWSYKKKIERVVINDPGHPRVETVADNIVADCYKAGMNSDYEKALWLHDWVVNNCEYDYSYLYCNAEGALTRGLGTCEAYHRAYVMLLKRAGIASGRMEGNGHVWTAVKIDNKWYQVDTTWDSSTDQWNGYPDLKHIYFGLNDELMTGVHSDHRPVSGYESNSLEHNYFIQSGKIKQYSDPFIPQIKSQLSKGIGNFSLSVPTTGWAATEDYRDLIYTLVAYQLSCEPLQEIGSIANMKVKYSHDTLNFDIDFWQFVSAAANPASPKVGQPATLSVTTSGNTSSLQYKFVWQKDGWAKWGVARDFDSASSCTWIPPEPGVYTIHIDIADSTNKVISKLFTVSVSPLTIATNVSSGAQLVPNMEIELSAEGAAQSSDVQYKFVWQKDNCAKWGTVADPSNMPTAIWKPTEAGAYTIHMDILTPNGNSSVARAFMIR